MASKLREMIGAQPAVLRAVADTAVGESAERLGAARRLFLVGTGTSFHAALLGSYLLRGGGLDAQAVSSSEFARWRPQLVDGDAVIVISHTGETAFAQAACAAARSSRVPLVTITGPDAGWADAIETPVRELSETYTVSYTAALGVLGLLAHALVGTDTGPDAVRAAADAVEAVIASPGVAQIGVPARALALIGPGIWGVTAREGALKIRESAHILAEGFDSELLLHGAAVPYGSGDELVALAPEADVDGLTAALVQAAEREGMTTHTLLSDDYDDGDGEGGVPAAPRAFLAQFPMTVRLQLLAAQLTETRGTDPDTAITGAWADAALWSAGAPHV